MIANLAVWFALTTAVDTVTITEWGPAHGWVPDWATVQWASLAITARAFLLVFRFRISTLRVLAICATSGVVAALTGLTSPG